MRRLLFSMAGALLLTSLAHAQNPARPIRLSILELGATPVGKQSTDKLRLGLRSFPEIQLLDGDLSAAAAHGIGYSGSLNMPVSEARTLGEAMDSDFFIIGDAQTLRRTSSETPVYYESYASIFAISSRTGRLVFWDRPSVESDTTTDAEEKLTKILTAKETLERCVNAIRIAQLDEASKRAVAFDTRAPLIEDAPDDEKTADAEGLRLPKPYRRLRPAYPESAARAEVEATVDVVVDVGADGEVGQVEVARWAGFGLDEITIATVRQLHFFPASRNGIPIPMRVLLRYNFRKPSQ